MLHVLAFLLGGASAACNQETTEISPGSFTHSGSAYANQDCRWVLEAPEGQGVHVNIDLMITGCSDTEGKPLLWNNQEYLSCPESVSKCNARVVQGLCPKTCNLCESCNYNWVDVRDGSADGPILQRACGNDIIDVTTSTNHAFVVLHRGDDYANGNHIVPDGDNFELTWRVAAQVPSTQLPCKAFTLLNESSVSLKLSDGYSGVYSTDMHCEWEIVAPAGQYVRIDYDDFHLEDPYLSYQSPAFASCLDDYVMVLDGTQDENAIIQRACGRDLPQSVTSSGNVMKVVFHSDSKVSGEGFEATASFTDIAGEAPQHCQGSVLLTEADGAAGGTIKQWADYAGDVTCKWQITAPAGKYVKVSWAAFNLEPSFPSCIFDNVTLNEGEIASVSKSNLLLTACDAKLPPPVTSKGRVMTMTFRSDENLAGGGFEAKYEFVDVQGEDFVICQGTKALTIAEGSSGYLTDGSAFGAPHEGTKECEWVITAPADQIVVLTYVYFHLQGSLRCDYDWVAIVDPASGNVLQQACGVYLPPPVASATNAATVVFHADNSTHGDGFMIHYEFVADHISTTGQQCKDGTLAVDATGAETSGIITDGANGYAINANCVWVITAPEGKFIELTFLAVDLTDALPAVSICHYEYISVRNGEYETSYEIVKQCGMESPAPVRTTGNKMRVQFYSDASMTGEGFRASWQVVDQPADTSSWRCFGTVHAGPGRNPDGETYGRIKDSPIGAKYEAETECSWHIQAEEGMFIQLEFNVFDMDWGYQQRCLDYVQVLDGVGPDAYSLGKFCGQWTPPKLISTGKDMYIIFKTDAYYAQHGFEARWQQVSEAGGRTCSGETTWTEPVGELSPVENNPYTDNTECLHIIQAPKGQIVSLSFTKLELERPAGAWCFDRVEVYDGDFLDAQGVAKDPMLVMCGSATLGTMLLWRDKRNADQGTFILAGTTSNLGEAGVQSTGQRLTVRFHSDDYVLAEGFLANWSFSGGASAAKSGVLGMSAGGVVGIVLAVLLAIVVIIVGVFCFCKHTSSNRAFDLDKEGGDARVQNEEEPADTEDFGDEEAEAY